MSVDILCERYVIVLVKHPFKNLIQRIDLQLQATDSYVYEYYYHQILILHPKNVLKYLNMWFWVATLPQNIFGDVFCNGLVPSVMGSCDRCSRTETCTFAAVICENLDYKWGAQKHYKLKFWRIVWCNGITSVTSQNLPRNLICNIEHLMVLLS